MNATHTRSTLSDSADSQSQPPVDWAAQVKLAVVLSVVAALIAAALAGRVPDIAIVVGAIVVTSLVAWNRVEPASDHRSPTLHVRRR